MNQDQNSSRRQFLANGALLGSGLAAAFFGTKAEAAEGSSGGILTSKRPNAPDPRVQPENVLYTACLQCNTGCGIKCRLQDGVVTKIDGNPYAPWTLLPHLPYSTPVLDAAPVDGGICPKGQAGLQTAYDPYRLRKVLKRVGKRGENKWAAIPFAQAIKEISEGGKLFANVPGEENRAVEGLQSLLTLTDPKVAKAMAAAVKKIWDQKDKAKKAELLAAFKTEFKDHLDKLIDPDHPDLGPKNNQIVVAWGRLKDGRGDFYKRFAAGLGTTNAHGHTTVCQGSLYFTCKAISEQYVGGKFSEGQKFYWQGDIEHSEFILFVGANLFEANYGPPNRSVRLTSNLVSGKTKMAVADPRFSKLASKAWKWLPLKPGTDAALAMGIMRWMFEEQRIDTKFLANANKAAAIANGENSWCNGTWLVEIKDNTPGKLIRASEHGLATAEKRKMIDKDTKEEKEYDEKFFVSMVKGAPVALDPNDEKTAVIGDLFVDGVLPDGTKVKSGLQVLLESSKEHTLAEWAAIADVKLDDLIAVARELTSHGKKVAVDIHRGPAQHTNGFYNVLSWMSLNMLLGNFDAKGGMIKGTSYDISGKGKWFDLKGHPGKISSFGVSSIRHGVDYEKTTLFSGYPAKRNWYPLASDVYEEIIPSIGDQYPYPVKALFLYMGAPTYSLPAGHTNIEILCDLEKMPLFISNDILIGSTTMYADYVFPDTTFLERWEFQGTHPNIPNKVQPVRQPVIAPIPEEVTVFGQTMPANLEAMVLGFAEALKLPGFGKNGFGEGKPLEHPDDLMLRAAGNLAFGEKPDASGNLPDASAAEIAIFLKSRSHLPKSCFDPDRWKAIVGEALWPKLVYLLNRGGRFEDAEKAYKGTRHAHPYGALLNLYQEKTAGAIYAGTGKHYPGIATYIPIRTFDGKEPDALRQGHDLAMITHRTVTQTKSRTVANPWLSPMMPENGILINPADAQRLGLSKGQSVKVVSATNSQGQWPLGNGKKKAMIGQVVPTHTIRPGVISFSLGFGHWATGACDIEVDGHLIKGDPRRQKGVHANAAMWIDPSLKNTCFLDPVGGSVSFYDTHVRLEPVPAGT